MRILAGLFGLLAIIFGLYAGGIVSLPAGKGSSDLEIVQRFFAAWTALAIGFAIVAAWQRGLRRSGKQASAYEPFVVFTALCLALSAAVIEPRNYPNMSPRAIAALAALIPTAIIAIVSGLMMLAAVLAQVSRSRDNDRSWILAMFFWLAVSPRFTVFVGLLTAISAHTRFAATNVYVVGVSKFVTMGLLAIFTIGTIAILVRFAASSSRSSRSDVW